MKARTQRKRETKDRVCPQHVSRLPYSSSFTPATEACVNQLFDRAEQMYILPSTPFTALKMAPCPEKRHCSTFC